MREQRPVIPIEETERATVRSYVSLFTCRAALNLDGALRSSGDSIDYALFRDSRLKRIISLPWSLAAAGRVFIQANSSGSI